MGTNAKIGLAVGVLVLMVFVFTVITTSAPEDPNTPSLVKGEEADIITREFIRYENKPIMTYDPYSLRADQRNYPGYYERGEQQVCYWIMNPNTEPLKVTFTKTSCLKCKYVDVAVVPAPSIVGYEQSEAAGALFGSTSAISYEDAKYTERHRVETSLPAGTWHRIEAGVHSTAAEIPAAKSKDQPTWAIIRLNINVGETKNFTATLGFQLPDTEVAQNVNFSADVALAQLADVYPPLLDFKDISESTSEISETLYYWSPVKGTTGPAETLLAKPAPPSTRGDPFLTFSKPVPMTNTECRDVATRISTGQKNLMPMRVMGGYKYTVTLNRTVPDPQNPKLIKQMDIGPGERSIEIVPESGIVDTVPKVVVKSNLLGAVTLEDSAIIDLGSFVTKEGIEKGFRLFSDKPNLELETVPELCEPKTLNVFPLSKPEEKNGRTYWTAKVRIEPNQGGGVLPTNSVVVLRIRNTGQIMRIPITGKGRS